VTRFRYNQQVTPPAPFVQTTFRRPESRGAEIALAAQIDTGAYRSVIPGRLVEELGLVPVRETHVEGFGGHLSVVSTYLIEIEILLIPPRIIEVIASRDEPFCLLGRDILNGFRLTLDGPGLILDIG
jgi:predicted aspartyl protease